MTYGRLQDLLLIGILLLVLSCVFLPPLVDHWVSVDRPPQLGTATVAAATNITVWTYKKTGLYYCPDSKLYGKVKPGMYMTQEKAQESGYQPAGGDTCH